MEDSNNSQQDTVQYGEDSGTITAQKAVEYTGATPDKPILKCPETGKFLPGTGTSGKGGRPKGAKDRVSTQMKEMAEDLMRRRGSELLEEVANRSPENALALVLKIIPPEELRTLFNEERAQEQVERHNDVRISVVAAPERLQDRRSQAEVDERQRGLEAPVERIQRPTRDDTVVATQDEMDAQAAQAERERQAKLRDSIKAHGGLTGRAPRGSATDTLDYPDDPSLV